MIKRSENSLNQHIKLKHNEFWESMKYQTTNTNDKTSNNKYRSDDEENSEDDSSYRADSDLNI